MENELLYQERLNRVMAAAECAQPDRVPVISFMENYAIGYAGATLAQCTENPQFEIETMAKVHQDVYFDAAFISMITHPIRVDNILGNDDYFTADDGITLQHKEFCPMTAEELTVFAEDPYAYLYNVHFVRKFPNLRGTAEERKKVIAASLGEVLAYAKKSEDSTAYFKEKLGMPMCTMGLSIAPADWFFDYFRGFSETMYDIRRHADAFKIAVKAAIQLSATFSGLGMPQLPRFPWTLTPLHMPTFLSIKQFEEFYWPTYKEYLLNVHARGGHVAAVLEGEWDRFMPFFEELPDKLFIMQLENSDAVAAKKRLGGKACVGAGFPVSLLRDGTKQQCIDAAKYLIDECAPGGGFFISTSKQLISPNDVKIENYRAVNEFIHDYGVYH
ncbi:hypothetical protein IZU99_03525 [Oscillospiraceae bacterium CM]|nr:hypothetical protein IZU99_03525 [Oscillospiraceae bacterium CM]